MSIDSADHLKRIKRHRAAVVAKVNDVVRRVNMLHGHIEEIRDVLNMDGRRISSIIELLCEYGGTKVSRHFKKERGQDEEGKK